MRHLLFLLALLGLLMPLSLEAQNGAAPLEEPIIQPGDSIQIAVWRRPELSGTFLVGADGSVHHPLYREVQLGGLQLSAAEERVGGYLAGYVEAPQFVLMPSFRVVVGGEVRQPGVYNLRPDVSIAEAVGLAGGQTDLGSQKEVVLIRDGRRIKVSLLGPGAEGTVMPVYSGDRILVERERRFFRDVLSPSMRILDSVLAVYTLILLL